MNRIDQLECLSLLKRGLRNSSYYYQSGQVGNEYANIDTTILGDDLKIEDHPQHNVIRSLAKKFADKIFEIESEMPFDRLCFIDKGGHGPVGAIALSSIIVVETEKEAMFVRPYRNTVRSISRGQSIRVGECLLIISDVATTGQTILQAASKLWEQGAIVRSALVFFNHELGAEDNLIANDIKLFSIYTRRKALDDSQGEITLSDKQPEFINEFGSVA